jgi:tetratricopeptide (TPR) repeat protein
VVGSLFVALASDAPSQIVFELPADGLTTPPVAVLLAGSFNDWSRGATTMSLVGAAWRAVAWLPDGRHYYRFLWTDARGKKHWLNDPASPFLADNGQHGANNFVDVRGGVRVHETGGLERFEWRAPNAKWVAVAGDFNGWYLGQFRLVKETPDTWAAWLPLKRPFSYKFIIDGWWTLDLEDQGPRAPNGLGGLNSFRPAAEVTSPSAVRISRPIRAGDVNELDWVTSYATVADYGKAVALARKVADVNATATGSTSPLVLRSLELEAAIHKRWNRLDDAAACWKRLADANVDTSITRRAINELAAYYLFVKQDHEAGMRLNELAIARAPNRLDIVRALITHLKEELRNGRWDESLGILEKTLPCLSPADAKDKEYAAELTELWLIKATIHNHNKQEKEARAAYEKIIEISPWSDSMNAQRARRYLDRHPKANSVPE